MNLTTRIIWLSAVYDLIVTAPFMTPWTARLTASGMAHLHASLGLAGASPSLDDPLTLLFANLMGSAVVVWSVLRVRTPTVALGAADTVGRVLFSSWMAFALLNGASGVTAVFLALEVSWALVQGFVVLRAAWNPR